MRTISLSPRLRLAVLLLLGFPIAFCPPAAHSQPATVPVDLARYQHIQYVSALTGSDESGNGSAAAPWKTLSFTLTKASDASSSKAYAILIASGSYTGSGDTAFTMKPWVDLYGGFDPITWTRDIDHNRTVLDGQQERRVMQGASASRIDGLTLQNGVTPWSELGGGIRFQSTSYSTVSNCTITRNSSGGVWSDFSVLSLENNAIVANTSPSGGGIYVKRSAFTMNGCRLSLNTASGNGGAVAFYQTSSSRLTGCTIDLNTSGRSGGGVFSEGTSTVLTGCTLTANSASEDGGGIRADYSPLRLRQCVITHNSAGGAGGGILCFSNSNALLTNCLIADNSAVDLGGALHCSTSSQTWVNCTVVSNTASDAAALQCNQSAALITNCILWNPGNEVMVSGNPSPAIRYSCVQGGWAGTGNVTAYALFVSPLDGDYHLKDGSPCIDSASQTLAPAADLEGTARPGGDGTVDMGAYEMPDGFLPASHSTPSRYYVDQSVEESGNGTSWTSAFQRIGEAMIAAEPGIEIWAAGGRYRESVKLEKGTSLLGGFGGTESDPSERKRMGVPTIIDASETGQRAVTAADGCTLDDIVLTGGQAHIGGGLSIPPGATVQIHRCVIKDNTATESGGGVSIVQATAVLTACRFEVNHASGGYNGMGGGGLHISSASRVRISDSTFSANTASSDGGAAYCTSAAVELNNCTLVSNLAADSGGAFAASLCAPRINRCLFLRNQVKGGASGAGGGGVYCEYCSPIISHCTIEESFSQRNGGGIALIKGSTAEVSHCLLNGNTSSGAGGGLHLSELTAPHVTYCIFTANKSGSNGGGVYCSATNGEVVQCTIERNEAGSMGGGLLLYGPGLFISNCSISRNVSQGHGGGVSIPGSASPVFSGCRIVHNTGNPASGGVFCAENTSAKFVNCLICSNRGYGFYLSHGRVSLNHCTLVANSLGGVYESWSNAVLTNCILWHRRVEIQKDVCSELSISYSCVPGVWPGEGNVDAYPGFRSLEQEDYRLTDGSPCIDAGLLAVAPSTDIESTPRPGGDDEVDMGAYESPDSFLPGTGPPRTRVYVAAGVEPGGSGKSWSDPVATIGAALEVVPAVPEVWVASGTYHESVNMTWGAVVYGGFLGGETDLSQRSPHKHQTIIDATGMRASAVTARPKMVLDGFSITHGEAGYGGGLCFRSISEATIANCRILSNSATFGGGAYFDISSPAIYACTFEGNTSKLREGQGGGAGLYINNASPRLNRCTIARNSADEVTWSPRGGAVFCYSSDPTFTNCAIAGNSGRALFCYEDSAPLLLNCTIAGNSIGGVVVATSSPEIVNSILWNRGPEIDFWYQWHSNPKVVSSCLQGGWPGNSNSDAYPLFRDPLNNDFRLAVGSPCIDSACVALMLSEDIHGAARPGSDGFGDLGAYESPDSYIPTSTPPPGRYYIASGASTGGNGLSWESPMGSIQEALWYAAGGSEIWVKQGEYSEQVGLEGRIRVHGGFAGSEEDLTERLLSTGHSTIRGHTVVVREEGCLLDGFNIKGGRSVDGGGMYFEHVASVTVSNCTFTENRADEYGGGVHCVYSSPTLINCVITRNKGGVCGGGMCCMYDSYPRMMNCVFSENETLLFGGGLYCLAVSEPLVQNCTFWKNKAGQGSGVACETYCSPDLTSCVFTENSGHSPSYGGVVYCNFYSSPTLINCILWNNPPQMVYADNSGMITSFPSLKYCDVLGGWYGNGHHNIEVDPMFRNESIGDFHLLPASPCFRKGVGPGRESLVAPTDIDGDPRSGATCDIGADEFRAPTGVEDWPEY